jgi:hypothetical protein
MTPPFVVSCPQLASRDAAPCWKTGPSRKLLLSGVARGILWLLLSFSGEAGAQSIERFELTVGQVVTNGVPGPGAGNIETPGSSDVFTFNATAGQSVYFDALTGNPCDSRLRWKCVGPTNQVLFDQWFAATPGCGNGDPGTFTFTASGSYTVTVYGFTDAIGTYAFQVMPVVPQPFALPLGVIVTNGVPGPGAGSIETPGALDVFTLHATAGESVYFDALTGNPCDSRLRWKCVGPTNQVLFDQWFAATPGCGNGDPGTFTFTASGSYTVTVYGFTDAIGTYAFQVMPVVPQPFALPLGVIVTNGVPGPGSGSIETPGALDVFTSMPQRVKASILTRSPAIHATRGCAGNAWAPPTRCSSTSGLPPLRGAAMAILARSRSRPPAPTR